MTTAKKSEIASMVKVSQDGRPSVDPNVLIRTAQAQAHLEKISKGAFQAVTTEKTAQPASSKRK